MNEDDLPSDPEQIRRLIEATTTSIVYCGSMSPEVDMSSTVQALNDSLKMLKAALLEPPADPLAAVFTWLEENV